MTANAKQGRGAATGYRRLDDVTATVTKATVKMDTKLPEDPKARVRHALEVLAESDMRDVALVIEVGNMRLMSQAAETINQMLATAGLRQLRQTMEALPQPVSPSLVRAAQATENFWRSIDEEFGLLTSEQVSEVLGSQRPNRTRAADERRKGHLLAAHRGGRHLYPAFQFDAETASIRDWVAPLIALAGEREKSHESVILWMVTPTTYLGEERNRPADHVDDGSLILEAARRSWDTEW